jgi:hypothetical protein
MLLGQNPMKATSNLMWMLFTWRKDLMQHAIIRDIKGNFVATNSVFLPLLASARMPEAVVM